MFCSTLRVRVPLVYAIMAAMWWREHVVPRLVDKLCSTPVEMEARERVCADLAGDVLEIGFGSGRNLTVLPPAVTSIAAVDPSGVGWKLAAERIAESTVPVRRAGLDGQRLDLPDASVDAVLVTWSLCTIPDPGAALREAKRVLKPGGTLHFVEHGLAPDDGVVKWQRRMEPVQKRLGGGCHLTRRPDLLLADAGFTVAKLDRYYARKTPRVVGATYEGVAGV